jgi:hypothetical protein
MATQMDRLTATGDVGTAGKDTFLKSVVVEGTGTVTLRKGGSGGTIFAVITANWTAGDEKGVAAPLGLHYTKGAETSASFEYTQRP